jgi:dienelactone hydrolase
MSTQRNIIYLSIYFIAIWHHVLPMRSSPRRRDRTRPSPAQSRAQVAAALGALFCAAAGCATLACAPAPPPPAAHRAAPATPAPKATIMDPQSPGAPGDETSPEARARSLVDALHRRAFAEATGTFSDEVRAALSAEQLEGAWDATLARHGAWKACGEATSVAGDGRTQVSLRCEHAREPLEVRVTYDASGKVIGLFFRPAAPPWDPPSYARAGAFQEREVTVGAAPWALPGTLTLPTSPGRAPAVVLVHGSGPNDRDETVGARRPFKDLALGLASRGVAVLRFDKRTRVHGAKLAAQTTLTVNEESVDDALAAAALLRQTPEIDARRVFVAGHSLGGELVPRIGARDPALAGLIILAGSTRPLGPVMIEQLEYIFGLSGAPRTAAEQAKLASVRQDWARIEALQQGGSHDPAELLLGAPASYWLDLRGYDAPALAKTLRHPIFVVQGGRDYQVTLTDFARWKAALAGRPATKLEVYPALDHTLAPGTGKSQPADYQRIDHVDEALVRDLASWIVQQRAR